MKYAHITERLLANTLEPALSSGCWRWAGKRDRWGYGRVNLYVKGLGKVVTLQAHIALFLAFELGAEATVDDIYLANVELQASGLELDHLCVDPACGNVDHLDPVTASENCKRRQECRVFN